MLAVFFMPEFEQRNNIVLHGLHFHEGCLVGPYSIPMR
jgi:hypothetical protein